MGSFRWIGLVLAGSLLATLGCKGGGTSTPAVQAPASLAYSINPAVYTLGTAITSNQPSTTGGTPTSYRITPSPPAGLSLDASTGVLSGIPTAVAAAATYTVTATNAGGSAAATLAITVQDVAPSGLSYTLATASYTVGTAIASNAPAPLPAAPPTSYAVSPALPPGIALDTATGVISGMPTAVSATASYTVTAANAVGSATAVLSITVYASGSTLDLSVAAIELTQSTQTLANTVPVVAGKNGLARVFVVANQANTAAPDVRITLTNNGVAVSGYPRTVAAPAAGVPTSVDEGTLAASWNLVIPGTDLAAPVGTGYGILAVVDPLGAVPESDRTNNALQATFTSTSVNTFRTTLFPVVLASGTGRVTESTKAAWVARLARMFPIADVDVVVGSTFTGSVDTLGSDGTNWDTLLSDLMVKHRTDGATNRYYYGALQVGYSSGVAGQGYVPNTSSSYAYRTAIGWDKTTGYSDGGLYPEVFAHETGHNFGLSHAPCGSVSTYDASYPYSNALTGTWGYDSVLGVLDSPTIYTDIMGYCTPKWVSDYNYAKVLDSRAALSASLAAEAQDSAQECLMVRGLVHKDGTVTLLPGFRTRVVPTTAVAAGDLRLEGLDAAGATLFSTTLETVEAGCQPGAQDRHFLVALPLATADVDALTNLRVLQDGELLATRATVSAKALAVGGEATLCRTSTEAVAITWDASVHPAVMVRDGATGEVLAILSGGSRTLQTTAASLDLVFSDGVKGPTVRMRTKD